MKPSGCRFTSGLSGLNLSDVPATATAGPTPETPEVALYEASAKGASPTHFAVLTLPLQMNGEPRGTLVVYLNQTDQANVLSDYFGIIAAITLLLLGVGIATPAAFAWMRSQERRQAEEQVRYLESHDALTGLANRRAFVEGLSEAMQRMTRDRTQIAVLGLDIDKFKEINDAADHAGGDQVLREIGARIKLTLRDRDLLARLSGDEFAIALVDITNLGDVMAFMNRLVDALRRPFQVGDKDLLLHDERRHRHGPRRRRQAHHDTAPCGHRSRARQGRRRPAHVLLRAEHGQGAAAPAPGRARAQACARTQRVRRRLPAAIRPRHGAAMRVGGSDPLASSGAWQDRAGTLHLGCRGHRPHRADRRMGAPARLQRRRDVVGAADGRGQSVARAVPRRRHRRDGRASPEGDGARPLRGSSSRSPRASSSTTPRRC